MLRCRLFGILWQFIVEGGVTIACAAALLTQQLAFWKTLAAGSCFLAQLAAG